MKISAGASSRALLFCFSMSGGVAKPIQGIFKKSDIPSTGWIPLKNGGEFHPGSNHENDPQTKQALNRMLGNNGGSLSQYSKEFVESRETYYDEYAQAWRLLGFYIDCNSFEEIDVDYDYSSNNNDYRDLEDAYDGNGAYDTVCTRYLLWAGYVDPNYEGGGVAEYQQYNHTTRTWDSSHCQESSRCAKMDCHEVGTNYKLLGIFKEANLDNWFDQLLQHQGSCVWPQKVQYTLSQSQSQNAWPIECTRSNTYDKDGNYIYYHSKPLEGGKITIGLYTESSCKTDYTGRLAVEDVLTSIYVQSDGGDDDGYAVQKEEADDGYAAAEEEAAGDDGYAAGDDGYAAGDDRYSAYANAAEYYGYGNRRANSETAYYLYKSIGLWNDAFDAFKICKPCKAWQSGAVCTDATGAYGANQCMLFSANTKMNTATFKDAALASEQGTIVSFTMDGTRFGHGGFSSGPSWVSIGAFCAALVVFVAGIYIYIKARKSAAILSNPMKQPLVESDGVML